MMWQKTITHCTGNVFGIGHTNSVCKDKQNKQNYWNLVLLGKTERQWTACDCKSAIQSKNAVCANIKHTGTSIKHSISSQSTPMVKGCIDTSERYCMPLVTDVTSIDCLLISSEIFQGKRK